MTRQREIGRSEPILLLQNGDSGEAVHELQQLLNQQSSNLSVDGQFGAATLTAVISFQQKKGLHVSGQVDQQTWEALH